VIAIVISVFLAASAYAQTKSFFKLVEKGTPQEVQAAINSGAKVNAQDKNGFTPLMIAAENNKNPEVITTLLKAGADVNAKDKGGWTALMAAASGQAVLGAGPAGYNQNTEAIVVLLKAGADVNAQSNVDNAQPGSSHLTALMMSAAFNPNPEAITTLVKAGANINAQDEAGATPLMKATYNIYNPEVVTALLKAGANAKVKDSKGYTALDYANGLTNSGVIAAGMSLKMRAGNMAFQAAAEPYRQLQEASK
jgi:ankyrin repeat protein